MRLSTALRPARNIEDVPVDPARAEHERQVRRARIEFARRQPNWQEIPETRLVPRSKSYLVDAESDVVYTVRRGLVFEPGSATVGYVPPNTELTYIVGQDGDVVVLDTPFGSMTWSEIVRRQARRQVGT